MRSWVFGRGEGTRLRRNRWASLKDAEKLTKGLEDLVGQLRSELTNGNVDFEKLVSIPDQISESADGIAETFSNVNDALMSRIEQPAAQARRPDGRPPRPPRGVDDDG